MEIKSKIACLVASWGGVGYLPKMPGTFGTLAAFMMAWLMLYVLGHLMSAVLMSYCLWGVSILVSGIGYWACCQCFLDYNEISLQERVLGKSKKQYFDPSWIVVDEVAGYFIAISLVSCKIPLTPFMLVLVFILFRILDIQKPWPIHWVEKKLSLREKTQPLGVMVDDIVAGLLAAVITLLVFGIA